MQYVNWSNINKIADVPPSFPPNMHDPVLFARASGDGTSIDSATSASTATFVTALVCNAIVFGAELAVFTLIRPYFKAIYEPLTYVPAPEYVLEL